MNVLPDGTWFCIFDHEYDTGGLKVDLHSNSTSSPIGTVLDKPDWSDWSISEIWKNTLDYGL